jgi:hypothetical protein
MEPDFKVKVLGKNRKLDIAIFKPGQAHTVDNLYALWWWRKLARQQASSQDRKRHAKSSSCWKP